MDGESLSAHITFPYVPGQPYNPADRYPFWYLPITVEWFKKRGYTLYERIADGISRPALPFEPSNDANHPWPYYDSDVYDCHITQPPEHLRAQDSTGKIVFAQDSLNRHVVIKLVRDDTDEYRILRFLNEQSMNTLEENCVIPVLELLPTEGFWFAVMPRWGNEIYNPRCWQLSDTVDLIHCMLKGLAFLHENNIAHGDLGILNVLVNHFCDDRAISISMARKNLRHKRCLSYVLFDFDHSAMFPPTADKRELRLPYQRSWGSFSYVGDTDAGEYEYDPFAFDVGNLGTILFISYPKLIPAFPGLVPLFDMMKNWDVRRRCTAAQALEFFEARLSELSEAQLAADISKQVYPPDDADLWATLPPDLAEKWRMCKASPEPWSRRLLYWICNRPWMHHIVPWTRWVCFQMFSVLPRRGFRWTNITTPSPLSLPFANTDRKE